VAEELVLTFPRTLLDEIGSFQGLRTDIAAYVPRILEAQNTRYVPRSLAEDDPSLKQIIPYVLVRRGDTLLHYVRGKGSGEKRLVAKGSIGIGGHINHRDEDLFAPGPTTTRTPSSANCTRSCSSTPISPPASSRSSTTTRRPWGRSISAWCTCASSATSTCRAGAVHHGAAVPGPRPAS